MTTSPGRVVEGVETTAYTAAQVSDPEGLRIHFSNDVRHLPMLVEETDGSSEMVFTQWGEPVPLTAPGPSHVITPAEIGLLLKPPMKVALTTGSLVQRLRVGGHRVS